MENTRQKMKWIWKAARQRCYNPKDKRYFQYGGRGICMCQEWSSFAGFLNDMQSSYKDGMSLERIDVNGNYCKDNCKWIPLKAQSLNKGMYSRNISGVVGINWHAKHEVWTISKRINSKYYWVGQHKSLEKAKEMLETWLNSDSVKALLLKRNEEFNEVIV